MSGCQLHAESATKSRVEDCAAPVRKHRCEQQGCTPFLSRPSIRAALLLLSCLLALFFSASLHGGTSLTLAWDRSPSPDVVGYTVYYGTSSHSYTNSVQTGADVVYTIRALEEGTTYFFAVTAYDSNRTESDFSNEITYTVPVVQPAIQVSIMPGGQVMLKVTGRVGSTYRVLLSPDQRQWSTLATRTVGPEGSFELVKPPGTVDPYAFYRLVEVNPLNVSPNLQLRRTPDGTVHLSGIGQFGHAYNVLAAEDLAASLWNILGMALPDKTGVLTFTDVTASSRPSRFYRLQEMTSAVPQLAF